MFRNLRDNDDRHSYDDARGCGLLAPILSTLLHPLAMTQDGMSIISVHTPTNSFAVLHSCELSLSMSSEAELRPRSTPVTQETLQALFSKLSKKTELLEDERGRIDHVGPGWVKYEFQDNVWNLDDGASIASSYISLGTARLPPTVLTLTHTDDHA